MNRTLGVIGFRHPVAASCRLDPCVTFVPVCKTINFIFINLQWFDSRFLMSSAARRPCDRGGSRAKRCGNDVQPARKPVAVPPQRPWASGSEEHTSELQSLMRISYAVFCLKKKKKQ